MPRDTRLAALLFRSHAALALVLACAVALPLGGLVRTRALLTELHEVQLASIDAEEAIYRAAWKVEVATRHATRRCLAQPDLAADTLRPALQEAARELERAVAAHQAQAHPRILRPALGYHALVLRTQTPSLCRALNEAAGERLVLDEDLTNAWIERLRALHGALEERERRVRRTVALSAFAAVVFGAAGVLVAATIGKRAARRVTRPLAAASAAAVRLGQGDFGPVGVSSDIQEIHALAEALDRMQHDLLAIDRYKQQILAAVSHELHTPLGKLREALELLADGTTGPLTPRQERVIRLARDACEREVHTVNELLDVSRLRSGQPLRTQNGCDLDTVLRAALEREQGAATSRGVTLELLPEGPPLTLTMDLPLVERAVANLLRNAVSVSAPGQVVRLRRRQEQRGAVRLARVDVEDQGPGLPAALRADPFRAFDSAPVGSRGAGLGLGLALAREVARAHGGDVVVDHSDAQGARFTLLLPLLLPGGAVHTQVESDP